MLVIINESKFMNLMCIIVFKKNRIQEELSIVTI